VAKIQKKMTKYKEAQKGEDRSNEAKEFFNDITKTFKSIAEALEITNKHIQVVESRMEALEGWIATNLNNKGKTGYIE
jgi:hypothetical protein